jgi:5'-3' exonuclease
MGIPTYFAFLIKQYPTIIKKQLSHKIGRIFLDLNCAIHPCCRNIIEKYKDVDISNDKLEEFMIKEIINYIKKIYNFSLPSDLFYIAIDGVAPRAKCSQQRLRRFKSVKEKKTISSLKLENGYEDITTWDTNAITPGTIFMDKLNLALKKFIKEYEFKVSKIILSDSTVPGEGEHKILEFIKKNKKSIDLYDIIYGLDADLIMLALSTNNNKTALLREPVHYNKQNDIENEEEFLYLDIDDLKTYLVSELSIKLDSKSNKISSENIVKDYIFMCIMLGNDFLPHLPSLTIKTGGLDYIIDTYSEIKNKTEKYLIDNNTINLQFLKKIFEVILNDEDKKLLEIYNFRKKFRLPRSNTKDYYEEKLHELNYYPILNKKIEERVLLGNTGWRERYYKSCFDNLQGRGYEINKICKNYLEGLSWNLEYYFKQCPSWDWYYKYRHAPSVYDLLNYIECDKFSNQLVLNQSIPNSSFSLLMMVLPPESHHLLPESYQKIYLDINSGIAEYYPINYELDTLNKKFYWECIPILPDINLKKLTTTLPKLELTISENNRNKVGNELVIIGKHKK